MTSVPGDQQHWSSGIYLSLAHLYVLFIAQSEPVLKEILLAFINGCPTDTAHGIYFMKFPFLKPWIISTHLSTMPTCLLSVHDFVIPEFYKLLWE